MRELLLTLEALGYEAASVLCRPDLININGSDVEVERIRGILADPDRLTAHLDLVEVVS